MSHIFCNRHTTLRVEAFSDAPGTSTSMSSAERFFPSCIKSSTWTRSTAEEVSKFQFLTNGFSKISPAFLHQSGEKQGFHRAARSPSTSEGSTRSWSNRHESTRVVHLLSPPARPPPISLLVVRAFQTPSRGGGGGAARKSCTFTRTHTGVTRSPHSRRNQLQTASKSITNNRPNISRSASSDIARGAHLSSDLSPGRDDIAFLLSALRDMDSAGQSL